MLEAPPANWSGHFFSGFRRSVYRVPVFLRGELVRTVLDNRTKADFDRFSVELVDAELHFPFVGLGIGCDRIVSGCPEFRLCRRREMGIPRLDNLFGNPSSNLHARALFYQKFLFPAARDPVLDAIVLSDLHLGSDNCQARALTDLLERIRAGEISTQRVILNGDLFDSIDFRRLNKHHWRVLSLLRKLSNHLEITWINGNHDGPAEIVSHLLGVEVRDEFILESGGKRILFLHGHRFDEFIDNHPILTAIADGIYRLLQRIDRSHSFAKYAKKKSKTFLRCSQKIQDSSIEYARKLHCQIVSCGHTHLPLVYEEGPVWYYNSGCWTEKPCHYLSVKEGRVELHEYEVSEEASDFLPMPIKRQPVVFAAGAS
jgi:UDP-2,3-diacylglucosamine pyrophosphatase LpxH